MSEYRIGYKGQLQISTKACNLLTYPDEVFYTPPFKLTNFFRVAGGGIEYIIMNASAGLMAGDDLTMDIKIQSGSKLSLSSQSYEKVHKMENGFARRISNIVIAKDGYFCYNQLPVIPYCDSALINQTNIHLENLRSKLILSEIIISGRIARNEIFKYNYYHNLINVFCDSKLSYRDNCYLSPAHMDLCNFGFYENYSHMGMMLIYGFSAHILAAIELIIQNSKTDSGITELLNNGYLIRAFANNAETLTNLFSRITIQLNSHLLSIE
ncbi:MAG: hypothetical protein RL017_738 [Pseudomonadota bacterium]